MKKLMIMSAVVLLSALSAPNVFNNAEATLTSPIFDSAYKRTTVGSTTQWYVTNAAQGNSSFFYQRTMVGSQFRYYGTFTDFAPAVDLTMEFQSPTTTFEGVTGSFFRPTNALDYIGSDPVDSTADIIYIKIENDSTEDYKFYLDIDETTSASTRWFISINDVFISNTASTDVFTDMSVSTLNVFYIPAKSTFIARTEATEFGRYFNALYIDSLGTSAAYNDGVTAGQLWGGSNVFDIVGSALGAVSNVLNIYVLPGNVTLGMIVLVPLSISLLFFVLGIISGRKR